MKFFLVFIFLFNYLYSKGQYAFSRIEADFSIKEKNQDGSQKLTMGKLYFNLKNKQLIYDVIFPKKELIFINDTVVYQFRNDQLVSEKKTGNLIEFSVFNLALQGDLPYFGIKKTSFTLSDIEQEAGLVISTWLPPQKLDSLRGKIIISQKQKQLFGMISYSPQNQIIAKQFFRKYETFQGLLFPTEVVNYTYFEGKKNVKMTTYKNVKINNYTTDSYYQYHLPK